MSTPTSPPGADTRTLHLVILCVTLLIALDLICTLVLRLKTGAFPVVFGDLSKVGIGILGGVVMDRAVRPSS